MTYASIKELFAEWHDHPALTVFAAGVAGIGYARVDIETMWNWFRRGWDAKQAAGDGGWLP